MARQQRVDWGDGERDHQTNGGGDHHLNGEQYTKKGEERIDDWGRDNVIEGSNGRLSPGDGDVEIGMDRRCADEHIPLQSSEGQGVNGSIKRVIHKEDVDDRGVGDEEEDRMSQLDVPRSLYSSNILGLSQETDSDAESIR